MAQWTNSVVLKFLEAYRAEPALWDPSDERNKDRIAVQAIWRRLSQTLKIPVPDLKRKKESLMATYRYYARKRRLTKRSAGSADDVYQPTWYAFKCMDQFLNKVYKGVDTLDAPQAQDDIEYSEYYIESSPIEQETEQVNIDDPPRSQQRNTTKRRRKRRRLTPVQLEVASDLEVEDSSAAAFNNIVPKKAKEESDDDCELYGKLLAMKLRRLPEWQRQIVMYELDGIVLNKLNQFKTSQSSFASSTRVVKSPIETGEESISE